MIALFRKPLFWTNVAVLIFAGWLIAAVVMGFNNPTQNPPGGSGAVSVDGSGNVGVGAVSSGNKFNVAGNISLNGVAINTIGTINAVGNPLEWTKLKNVPAGLADGIDDGGGAASWASITGKPAGFADNVDNVNGTAIFSSVSALSTNQVTCAAGTKIVVGQCGTLPVVGTAATYDGITLVPYLDTANNKLMCQGAYNVVIARCLVIQ